MSQSDFGTIDPDVMDGTELAAALNSWRDALYSKHRGATRPTYVQAGQDWLSDAAGPTGWAWNFYSGATRGDLLLATIDTTGGTVTLPNTVRGTTNPTASDASQQLATDAFVQAAVNAAVAAALATIFPVGCLFDLVGTITVAPAGWVLAKDGTIGNAASGASIRANADCANLYAHIWNGLANTEAPVSGGRGANAAADFAANKTIGGLDFRGLVRATFDAFGGTAAGRLNTLFPRMGVINGEQAHLLLIGEIPSHSHQIDAGLNPAVVYTTRSIYGDGTNVSQYPTEAAGGGASHNVVQPTRTVSTIIKL